MNKKYLFGMLLSGAMLAACTADDFDTAQVAQKVNPSAPVFTVSFDGDLENRAAMNAAGTALGFQDGDKLSLFHGIADAESDMSGWQNAVYVGEESSGDAFQYTTAAMVNEGNAIMIYPAELGFKNNPVSGNLGTNAPKIVIDQDQNEETINKMPYMSEILDIKVDNTGANAGKGKAGYGEDYEIKLKRVGSGLTLNLDVTEIDLTSADVPEIEITKVELNSGSDSEELFTIGVPVKAETYNANNTVWKAADHKSWVAFSGIDSTTVDAVSYITTTNVKNNAVAEFTLLPRKDDTESASFDDAKVVVYTTYGSVETSGSDDKRDLYWKQSSGEMTVGAGLKWVLQRTWYANTTSAVFKKELCGVHMTSTVKVDLNALNMDGLHIQNEDHLVNALKVYNALQPEGKVTFYLDGTDGKFVLTPEVGMKALVDQLEANEDDNYVEFVPCGDTKDELCTAIQLKNDGDELEVPNLVFGQGVNKTNSNTNIALAVELIGQWKYAEVAKDPAVAANEQDPKTLDGITTLKVNSGATLTLANYITVDEEAEATFAIENNGTVNVSGIVFLDANLNNNGTINIATTKDQIRVRKNLSGTAVTLTNNAAAGANADGWTKGAEISVMGTLGIVQGSQGRIVNYGYIKQERALAEIYVSENAEKEISEGIVKLFGNGARKVNNSVVDLNRIGTIELFDASADAGNHVTVEGNDGFIKVTVDAATPKAADYGTKANYAVLKGASRYINFGTIGTGNDAVDYMPSTITMVEVNSDAEEVSFANAKETTLVGLFVRDGKKISIPDGSEFTVTNVYLEGAYATISHAGEFTATNLEGYFGGDEDQDKNKIINKGGSN